MDGPNPFEDLIGQPTGPRQVDQSTSPTGPQDNPFADLVAPKTSTAPAAPSGNLGDVTRAGAEGLATGLPNAVLGLQAAQERGRNMGVAMPGADIVAGMIQPAVAPIIDKITGKKSAPIPTPISDQTNKVLTDKGIHPEQWFPASDQDTMQERIARMAGEGIVSMILPAGEAKGWERLWSIGKEMVAGGTGGAAAQLGMEVAPEEWKPTAGLVGGLVGGVGGYYPLEAAEAGVKGIARTVRPAVANVRPKTAEAMAAEQLGNVVGEDRAAVLDQLNQPRQTVSGAQETAAQVTGNVRLGSLERALARGDEAFKARLIAQREEQARAQLQTLDELQQGSPSAVPDYLNSRMRELEDQADELYAVAQAKARQAADLGDPNAGEIGRAARTAINDRLKELNTEASRLWKSVDPNGDTHLVTGPLIRETARVYGTLSPEAQMSLAPVEIKLANLIGEYGPTLPFERFSALRSQISAAMREVKSPLQPNQQAYARLSQLRTAIEQAVEDSVAGKVEQQQAAVANGTLSPDDTLTANFLRQAKEWYAEQGKAGPRAFAGDSPLAATQSGPAPLPRDLGAAGEAGRGPAGVAGDQGLPTNAGDRPSGELKPVPEELRSRGLGNPDLRIDADGNIWTQRAEVRASRNDNGGLTQDPNGTEIIPGRTGRTSARVDGKVINNINEIGGFNGQADRGAGVRPVPGTPARAEGNAGRQVGREPDGSLAGLPRKAGAHTASAYPDAQRVAQSYMEKSGLPYKPPSTYARVNPKRAARIAAAYDAMEHAPQDPAVKRAYDAMAKETLSQYQAMLDDGMKIEFIPPGSPDPYAGNPRNMTEDVRTNKHMWVFPTKEGFGSDATFDASDNPLLADSGFQISGQPATINDIFRAVHDYFGHVKEGVGFRADGEENAWRAHSAMYSPEARKAMTSETRGQNSWVNYGPYGESNRTARSEDTHYADQKIGILPDWAISEAAGDEIGAIRTDMAKRLESAGRPAVEADANAAITEAMYDAMGKRIGKTSQELADEFNLPSVTNEGPKGRALFQSDTYHPVTAYRDSPQANMNVAMFIDDALKIDPNPDHLEMVLNNDRDLNHRAGLWLARNEPVADKGTGSVGGAIRKIIDDEGIKRDAWEKQRAEQAARTPKVPTFYSATERAVSASKNNKANADQWMATLKNTPGVKPEELEWLNLEPWLRSQSGPVTKEAVQDYIRANQMEIEETHLTGQPVDEDGIGRIGWEPVEADPEYLKENIYPGSWAHDQAKEAVAQRRADDNDTDPQDELDKISDDDPEVVELALENEIDDYNNEPEYTATVEVNGHTYSLIRDRYEGNIEIYDPNLGKSLAEWERLDDAEIAQRIREHEQEYYGSEDGGGTRFHDYADQSGQDYTELLLKLPERRSRDTVRPTDEATLKFQDEWEALKQRYAQARQRMEDAQRPDSPERNNFGKLQDEYRSIGDQMDALHAKMVDQTINTRGKQFTGEDFTQSHWDDPNVVAHVRFDTRNLGGKKTLFIQEIQSDWHQQGREKAYDTPDLEPKREAARQRAQAAQKAFDDEVQRREGEGMMRLTDGRFKSQAEMQKAWHDGDLDTRQYEDWKNTGEASHQYFVNRVRDETPLWKELTDANQAVSGMSYPVPDAPFKTTWPELVLKRMIRHAAENGYDQIVWTPGDLQNGNIVTYPTDEIRYAKRSDGDYDVAGRRGYGDVMSLSGIASNFGNKVAEQVAAGEGSPVEGASAAARVLKFDQPIRIGNHGMQTFYGKMVPNMLSKMLKKFDTQLGRQDIRLGGQDINAFAVPITDKLRKMALEEGQPLFQKGKRGYIQFGADKSSLIGLLKNADASTAPHELAHHFLAMYQDIAMGEKAPNAIREDWRIVKNWWGKNAVHVAADAEHADATPAMVHKLLKDGTTGNAELDTAINKGMQEQWARAFEAYLRTGDAPTVGLKRVFEQFKQWLTNIYKSLTDLKVDLSPEIKGVFDRMLGGEEIGAGPKLMDAEQVGRFKAATAATKNLKEMTRKVGKIVQSAGSSYEPKMSDEAVASSLWGKGANAAANVRNAIEVGGENARQAVEDAAIMSLRSSIKDGVLSPDKLADWRAKHADKLEFIPELDKRLQSAAKATKAMEEIGERRKAAIDTVQKSAIGKILKLSSDADVAATVGSMLGKATAVKDMRTLVGTARKNPEALAGLRRAVVDYMLNRFTSSKDAVSAAAFLRFLGKNTPALNEVLSPEQMNNLRALGQEVKRATRDVRAPGGGSDTVENLTGQKKHVPDEKVSILRRIFVDSGAAAGLAGAAHVITGGSSWPLTIGTGIASALGSEALQSARAAGLRKVNELVQEAVLNPDVMKALLAKAPNKANTGSHRSLAVTLGKIGAFAAMAGAE